MATSYKRPRGRPPASGTASTWQPLAKSWLDDYRATTLEPKLPSGIYRQLASYLEAQDPSYEGIAKWGKASLQYYIKNSGTNRKKSLRGATGCSGNEKVTPRLSRSTASPSGGDGQEGPEEGVGTEESPQGRRVTFRLRKRRKTEDAVLTLKETPGTAVGPEGAVPWNSSAGAFNRGSFAEDAGASNGMSSAEAVRVPVDPKAALLVHKQLQTVLAENAA